MIAELQRTVNILSLQVGDPKILARTLQDRNVRAFIQDTALELYALEHFETLFQDYEP